MNIRREGNVLFITDAGIYEPPQIVPTLAKRRRARAYWTLAIVGALTAVTLGMAGISKLQRIWP